MELFIKYPNEVQQELLHGLLNSASKTEVGVDNDFQSIKNYNDFKNRMPVVSYEDIVDRIERCRMGEQNIFWPSPIKWFAKSSGTSNSKSKFIPISNESLEDCHYKAGKDMLSIYYNNHENAQILAGKCLRLGGAVNCIKIQTVILGICRLSLLTTSPFGLNWEVHLAKKCP